MRRRSLAELPPGTPELAWAHVTPVWFGLGDVGALLARLDERSFSPRWPSWFAFDVATGRVRPVPAGIVRERRIEP